MQLCSVITQSITTVSCEKVKRVYNLQLTTHTVKCMLGNMKMNPFKMVPHHTGIGFMISLLDLQSVKLHVLFPNIIRKLKVFFYGSCARNLLYWLPQVTGCYIDYPKLQGKHSGLRLLPIFHVVWSYEAWLAAQLSVCTMFNWVIVCKKYWNILNMLASAHFWYCLFLLTQRPVLFLKSSIHAIC